MTTRSVRAYYTIRRFIVLLFLIVILAACNRQSEPREPTIPPAVEAGPDYATAEVRTRSATRTARALEASESDGSVSVESTAPPLENPPAPVIAPEETSPPPQGGSDSVSVSPNPDSRAELDAEGQKLYDEYMLRLAADVYLVRGPLEELARSSAASAFPEIEVRNFTRVYSTITGMQNHMGHALVFLRHNLIPEPLVDMWAVLKPALEDCTTNMEPILAQLNATIPPRLRVGEEPQRDRARSAALDEAYRWAYACQSEFEPAMTFVDAKMADVPVEKIDRRIPPSELEGCPPDEEEIARLEQAARDTESVVMKNYYAGYIAAWRRICVEGLDPTAPPPR